MLAASKVKMSSSEIKRMECRNIYDFSFVEVVKNNGKEMYKKCAACAKFFSLKALLIFWHFSLPSPVSITPFLLILFSGVQF